MDNRRKYNKPFARFLTRWLVSSLGLWIAAGFLSSSITLDNKLFSAVIAGLVLAIINTVLKPILIILSLPAILLSLGLFMILINGLTVFIASKLYSPLHITNFWAAVFAGMIIGLVNFLVSAILKEL
jgi:putative membrane protein